MKLKRKNGLWVYCFASEQEIDSFTWKPLSADVKVVPFHVLKPKRAKNVGIKAIGEEILMRLFDCFYPNRKWKH